MGNKQPTTTPVYTQSVIQPTTPLYTQHVIQTTPTATITQTPTTTITQTPTVVKTVNPLTSLEQRKQQLNQQQLQYQIDLDTVENQVQALKNSFEDEIQQPTLLDNLVTNSDEINQHIDSLIGQYETDMTKTQYNNLLYIFDHNIQLMDWLVDEQLSQDQYRQPEHIINGLECIYHFFFTIPDLLQKIMYLSNHIILAEYLSQLEYLIDQNINQLITFVNNTDIQIPENFNDDNTLNRYHSILEFCQNSSTF